MDHKRETHIECGVVNTDHSEDKLSLNELKLLNLLAEIIVNASIREYYEKSD